MFANYRWEQERIMRKRAEGREERETTTQKIKNWKLSHGSPVTIFSSHVYGDSRMTTTRRQRKGQYQDSNGSEAGEWHTHVLVVTDLAKVLYDDAVDRAAPHSQAGVTTSGKNRPLCFSGVHDCWETSRDTYRHYLLSLLSLPSRFGPSL